MSTFSSIDGVVSHASLTMEWVPAGVTEGRGDDTERTNILFHDLVSFTPPPITSRPYGC